MIEITITETQLPAIVHKVQTLEDAMAIQVAFLEQDMHPNSWHVMEFWAIRERVPSSNQPVLTAWSDDGRVRIEIKMKALIEQE